MTNTAQDKKRARKNDSQRDNNASLRSIFRTAVKKIIKAIEGGDKKIATESYKENIAVIDRMADKRIVHKNKAARHKSRLNTAIKSL